MNSQWRDWLSTRGMMRQSLETACVYKRCPASKGKETLNYWSKRPTLVGSRGPKPPQDDPVRTSTCRESMCRSAGGKHTRPSGHAKPPQIPRMQMTRDRGIIRGRTRGWSSGKAVITGWIQYYQAAKQRSLAECMYRDAAIPTISPTPSNGRASDPPYWRRTGAKSPHDSTAGGSSHPGRRFLRWPALATADSMCRRDAMG